MDLQEKYKKPDKCPMSDDEWYHALGYCWAYAYAVDEGDTSFVEEHCPCLEY